MARAEDLVQEFRSMVDRGVEQEVKARRSRKLGVPLWGMIDGDKVIKTGGADTGLFESRRRPAERFWVKK